MAFWWWILNLLKKYGTQKSSTLFVDLSWLPIFVQYLTATIPESTNHPGIHPFPTCSGLPWSYKDTPSPRHYRAMHSIGVQGEHGLETKTVKCMSDWILELWFYRLKDELNVLNVPSRMIGESWHPFWLSLRWSLAEWNKLHLHWLIFECQFVHLFAQKENASLEPIFWEDLTAPNRKQTTDFNRWMGFRHCLRPPVHTDTINA